MVIHKRWQSYWLTRISIPVFLLTVFVLNGCQLSNVIEGEYVQDGSVTVEPQQETAPAPGQMGHTTASSGNHRAELSRPSPIELNPGKGQEIGSVFEAFLSPHQEGGEEEDTPALTPDTFKSTKPSVPRNERPSRGHGVLAFTNDLSKAFVYVAIEGVKTEDIVMFHIHCGRPGQLGPIIVDFALAGDLQAYWADDILALEITNEDLVAAANHGEGVVAAFTSGCPIIKTVPMDRVTTIAGMETIAREGELYFNLHTAGQVFFGDIRGKLQQVEQWDLP